MAQEKKSFEYEELLPDLISAAEFAEKVRNRYETMGISYTRFEEYFGRGTLYSLKAYYPRADKFLRLLSFLEVDPFEFCANTPSTRVNTKFEADCLSLLRGITDEEKQEQVLKVLAAFQ